MKEVFEYGRKISGNQVGKDLDRPDKEFELSSGDNAGATEREELLIRFALWKSRYHPSQRTQIWNL